jgi:hypothetical protein
MKIEKLKAVDRTNKMSDADYVFDMACAIGEKLNQLIDAHNKHNIDLLELARTIRYINKDNDDLEKKIDFIINL